MLLESHFWPQMLVTSSSSFSFIYYRWRAWFLVDKYNLNVHCVIVYVVNEGIYLSLSPILLQSICKVPYHTAIGAAIGWRIAVRCTPYMSCNVGRNVTSIKFYSNAAQLPTTTTFGHCCTTIAKSFFHLHTEYYIQSLHTEYYIQLRIDGRLPHHANMRKHWMH